MAGLPDANPKLLLQVSFGPVRARLRTVLTPQKQINVLTRPQENANGGLELAGGRSPAEPVKLFSCFTVTFSFGSRQAECIVL